MEMSEKKKTPLSDLMDASLAKIREMVDSNTVVGQPITTPDGVTLIPVSRLSFGFGAGGSDYGKQPTPNFGGGAGAGVKVRGLPRRQGRHHARHARGHARHDDGRPRA